MKFSVSTEAKPKFEHDCSKCKFLGLFEFDGIYMGNEVKLGYDLYTCYGAGYRTFIARAGDSGPNYMSCPEDLLAEKNVKHYLSSGSPDYIAIVQARTLAWFSLSE